MKALLIFIVISIGVSLNAAECKLPIPNCFKDKPLHYFNTPYLKGFSCGPNVLYNICKKEQELGFNNPYSDPKKFKKVVTAYYKKIKEDPSDASSYEMLYDLAEILGLENVYYLWLYKGVLKLIFPDNSSAVSMYQIKTKFKQLPKNKPAVVHFICHCCIERNPKDNIQRAVPTRSKYEPHVILSSVIRNAAGKVMLEVRDIMGTLFDETADIAKHIKYLLKVFAL